MPDAEDLILRPIMDEGHFYTLADINAGLVDLIDVIRANDAIDAREENRRRLHEAWQ